MRTFDENIIFTPKCDKSRAACEAGKKLLVEFERRLLLKGDKEYEWGPENAHKEREECEKARKAWYTHVENCTASSHSF